jgi:hypothetical protein
MIKLDPGNVLLKPLHRKQLLSWLRRSIRLGDRLGNFFLTIKLHRSGSIYEVAATVRGGGGEFRCHSRQHDWRDAARELVRMVTLRLHQECIQRSLA